MLSMFSGIVVGALLDYLVHRMTDYVEDKPAANVNANEEQMSVDRYVGCEFS